MDKIYSRKRFVIIKNLNKNKAGMKSNFNNIRLVIAVIIIAIIVAITVIKAIEPIINRQCINMAKSLATQISNEQTSIAMKNYNYDDFVRIITGDDGSIKMINSNIVNINEFTSDIAVKIQNTLDKIEDSDFSIRLGSFTGIKLFSGRGPKVNVRMSTIGSVETNLKSEFKSVGINQTLHRIYVEIYCTVAVLTPYSNSEQTILNQVLIAESVIVGMTPDTYYNLEGLSTDDSLNMI